MGMLSESVDEKLKEIYPKCSVLCIGPAGENQSLLAAIMNNKDRAAGRSGVGAVMGSKNLKTITVTSTARVIEPADAAGLKVAVSECNKLIRENG